MFFFVTCSAMVGLEDALIAKQCRRDSTQSIGCLKTDGISCPCDKYTAVLAYSVCKRFCIAV